MAKLVINLIQHTPIMHFEYGLEEPTLRGNELKPRLDAFLRKMVDDFTWDNYCMDKANGVKALNYRVAIKPIGNVQIESIEAEHETPYYYIGESKHKATWHDNGVQITFISKYKDLIDQIELWICHFFLFHNFGFRKGKGFGSFTVSKINDADARCDYANMLREALKKYRADYEESVFCCERKCAKDNWLQIEKDIKIIANVISSGIRKPNLSDIKKGAHKKGDYCFERAMTGLAEKYGGMKVTDKAKEIRRFPSPIVYKPVFFDNKWTIYILLQKIPDKMRERKFVFKGNGVSFELKTPGKSFSLVDILKRLTEQKHGVMLQWLNLTEERSE